MVLPRKIWTTQNGKRIEVSVMTDDHLLAAIRYSYRQENEEGVDFLMPEAKMRNLIGRLDPDIEMEYDLRKERKEREKLQREIALVNARVNALMTETIQGPGNSRRLHRINTILQSSQLPGRSDLDWIERQEAIIRRRAESTWARIQEDHQRRERDREFYQSVFSQMPYDPYEDSDEDDVDAINRIAQRSRSRRRKKKKIKQPKAKPKKNIRFGIESHKRKIDMED